MVNRGGAIDDYKSRRHREHCPLGSTNRSCRRGLVEGTEGGGRTQTRPNTGRTCRSLTLALFRSLLCTLACTFSTCFVFNRNPGGMAGLATSASISSFITWSACSGHRSLNGIRTLTTYTGARKSNLPNRRLLGRTITGSSQIPKVRFVDFTCSVFPAYPQIPPLATSETFMLQHPHRRPGTRIKSWV
jgi:hypothetical protein